MLQSTESIKTNCLRSCWHFSQQCVQSSHTAWWQINRSHHLDLFSFVFQNNVNDWPRAIVPKKPLLMTVDNLTGLKFPLTILLWGQFSFFSSAFLQPSPTHVCFFWYPCRGMWWNRQLSCFLNFLMLSLNSGHFIIAKSYPFLKSTVRFTRMVDMLGTIARISPSIVSPVWCFLLSHFWSSYIMTANK